MFAKTLAAVVLAAVATVTAADVASAAGAGDKRLVVVNGSTGRVVYDDGRDDYFCTSKRQPVGYARVYAGTDYYGRPVYKTVVRYGEVIKRCY